MLAKKALTDRGIAALKAADQGKRKLYWDAVTPGLAVRVTDRGAKSFVLVGRYGGSANPTARAIGKVGAISLADARKTAQDWLSLVAKGHDPATVRETPDAQTLKAISADWLAREGVRLRSIANLRSSLERNVLPRLGSAPIAEIKRSQIAKLLDDIEEERGPVAANRALALLRRIMNWHAMRSDDFRSPIVRGMARAEQTRDRVLSDDELRRIWRATSGQAGINRVFGGYVRFLLLTAARRNEAAHMRWNELQDGVWVLPASRNKTGQELVRPLCGAAQEVILGLPRQSEEWVFSRSGASAIGGLSQLKAGLDFASGVSGYVLHDLRRTARSLMSRAGVPSDHAERCLGHVIGGVRGVYDRHAYREEILLAYEKLATLISGIIDPHPNVVPIRGQG
jgi:integrase